MQTIVRTLVASLLVGTLAFGQTPADEAPVSSYSLYDASAGEVLEAIPHGGRISAEALGARATAVLLSLPAGARGLVELYVNGTYMGALDGPPYLIARSHLPARGDVVLLAIPDVGYPAEVRFTLE